MRFLFILGFCLAFVMVMPTQTSAGPPGPQTTINIDQNFDLPAIPVVSAGLDSTAPLFELPATVIHDVYSQEVDHLVIKPEYSVPAYTTTLTFAYNIESKYGEVVYAYSMAKWCNSVSYYIC